MTPLIDTPLCRRCRVRLTLVGLAPDRSRQTFQCRLCHGIETAEVPPLPPTKPLRPPAPA